MKKSTKIIIIVVAVLITVAILWASVMFFAIKNFKSYESSITVDKSANLLSSDKESIKIFQLTDLQTKNLLECAIAYPTVKRLVKTYQPDLIVLTGDNVSNGADRKVVLALIDLLDSFEIPWALVLGNHDHSYHVSEDEMSQMFEQSRYGIFKTGDIDGKHGNYYYNLELCGEVVRTLIFMDNSDYTISAEQVEWYREIINTTSQQGRVIPSFVFSHIPIPEMLEACELYKNNPSVGSGYVFETPSVLDESSGFFTLVKSLRSTDALFFGHDHHNNALIEYQDVFLCYGTKTGYTVDYEMLMVGGVLITVTADQFLVESVK